MFEREGSEHASEAYDAIRALNHQTIFGPIPGPVVYDVLGNLKFAGGYGLSQALEQLARGLRQSLDAFDVYEDDGGDSAVRAEVAAVRILRAARKAEEIGVLLAEAQADVSQQGYRENGA